MNRNTKRYLDSVANGSILVPHAYMSFFLPEEATAGMLNHLITTPDATLGASTIAVFPMLTKNFQQVLQKMPSGNLSFHVRVYRLASQEGSPDHLRMIKANTEDLVTRVLSLRGTVYPPHSPVLSPTQWQQHYGPSAWTFFSNAKKTYDPYNVLTPGLAFLGRERRVSFAKTRSCLVMK